MKPLSECLTVHCRLLNLFRCVLLVLQFEAAFYWYSLLLQLTQGFHSSHMMLMCSYVFVHELSKITDCTKRTYIIL
jgi:hypothetical protein